MSEQREQRRVSRRTIAKGAAWAVPAVPLVVATPAYAASGGPPTITIGDACKLPGNACGNVFVKGYVFELTVANNTGETIWIYDGAPPYDILIIEDDPTLVLTFQAAIYQTGPNAGDVVVFPLKLDPGDSAVLVINAGTNDNSSQQALTLTVSMPWGHTAIAGADPDSHPRALGSKYIAETPPEQGAQCFVTIPVGCG